MQIGALHCKKVLLSIHNNVKSEWHFAVTSGKRLAVIQRCSNVVSKEAREPNPPTRIINVQHLRDQTTQVKLNAVNKNVALI